MNFEDYWYVIAESEELTTERVLSRRLLDEALACFRGRDGTPAILRDRCLHRNAPLSAGQVRDGLLSCSYHGWTYDGNGRVVAIPSISPNSPLDYCSPPYPALEREGYVYARLNRNAPLDITPFGMPHYRQRGWKNLRLQNRFSNNVSNCVENFIDIPHTAFVHRTIFRSNRCERLTATISRVNGEVHVAYRNEHANLGTYRWFLNPAGDEIRHTDSFYAPNVTSVVYEIGAKTFIITSQAVPLTSEQTLVYTDLSYNFGAFNALAAPFVRRHAQRIIAQDVEILGRQMEVIRHYGAAFHDAPSDAIHRCVDSIREAVACGDDPRTLPPLTCEIEFYV